VFFAAQNALIRRDAAHFLLGQPENPKPQDRRWRQFMKNWLRWLVGIFIMLGTLLLSNCSPYGCRVTFGSSTCTGSGTSSLSGGGSSGGSGGGGGGGSNATPTAFVYAVDQTGGATGNGTNGTIDGYDLSNSAASFLPLQGYTAPLIPATDPGAGMVVVNKQFVYAIFELTGVLEGWSINSSSGALAVLSGFPVTVSFNLPITPGQFQMTTDPGGNYLFVSDSGDNEIFVYSINGTTGALTAAIGSPFGVPSIEPGNITTDGLGRFLYVSLASAHEGGSFEAFSIGTGGVLTFINSSLVSTLGAWQLQGDASGKYLIGTSGNSLSVSGADDLHLYVFSINQSTGIATATSGSPVTTQFSPFTIAMQPASSNGELVYSFGPNDGATAYNGIEGFQLDPTTGVLTELSGSPFSNGLTLGFWGQFDQSGSNLLVYSSAATSGGTLVQLAPLQVSSSGALTEPISAVTLNTSGYWVVTNP
jgi:6-phosphogluconolactonase